MRRFSRAGGRLVALYFLDTCWVLGFVFLSFAIPFLAAVQHSDYPKWEPWDKHLLWLMCSISSVTTLMALFKQMGKRLRAGQDPLPDDDEITLPAPNNRTTPGAQDPGETTKEIK